MTGRDSTSRSFGNSGVKNVVTGREMAFQARSVVGGVFIKALLDPAIAARWQKANAE